MKSDPNETIGLSMMAQLFSENIKRFEEKFSAKLCMEDRHINPV